VNFFFDNNMPVKLARALNELQSPNHRVCHLRDKFKQDVDDIKWLNALANDQDSPWIIVSGDMRISRNAVERKAWLDLGHIIFFLSNGWTNIIPNDQLWKLVKIFPKIIDEAGKAKPGSGFIVPPSSLTLRRINV